MNRTIVIGTRGSVLALAQTKLVVGLLNASNRSKQIRFETKSIRTDGDDLYRKPGSKATGKEAFTGTIDRALEEGSIDVAVHSLKDVPVENFPKKNIELCAFPKRGSPFDVLISKRRSFGLESLSRGSKVGTSSLRRAIQLKSYRPDFEIVEIHGNVNTRIIKMRQDSELDAIVLAEAGLERLGLIKEVNQVLPTEIMLPAVGQGCLAVAVRSDDPETKRIVSKIDEKGARTSASAERAFSRTLGGGCNLPIAAFASFVRNGRSLLLEGLVADQRDGCNLVMRDSIHGSAREAESLGETLALRLKTMSR
ncbi:MAG: hydroxymethylbilane synthase [Nitrososphaerales archaeon]